MSRRGPRGAAGIMVAGIAGMLALAACGSSVLSTAALRTRASRICRLATARENRIPTPAAPGQAASFLKRGVAAIRPELTALRRLDPDGKAAPVYRRALAGLDAELRGLQASVADLGLGGDPVIAIKTLQRQLAPVALSANATWKSLGIPDCVSR